MKTKSHMKNFAFWAAPYKRLFTERSSESEWLWCSDLDCLTSFILHFTFLRHGELLCLWRLHKLQPVRT